MSSPKRLRILMLEQKNSYSYNKNACMSGKLSAVSSDSAWMGTKVVEYIAKETELK